MAQDIGTLLVKITADISDLKKGVAQAKAEIKSLQDSGSGGGGMSGWSGAIGQATGAMRGLITGAAAFLGTAISIYGALNLWWTAVNGFVSLMSTAIGTVDEFKMGIVSTAGMMTAITDRTVEPNLDKAYSEWKTYLDWLYRASLETDRKVASGGQEIFETAKQLAIRGMVPNDKDQVYTVGLLSDFIKTVTQGLSQRQQLIQEVRAMFEGAMRPGAQALAQFVAIDPDFKAKFEAARAAAISMKDATPIFDLLQESLKGMTFAAQDTQNTFEALTSTAKGAFTLLMIESFGAAYEEIVKVGWALLDVFYKEGQLTDEGMRLSASLVKGWNEVKGSVFEFIEYVRANPQVVTQFVNNVTTALGQAAQIAMTLASWLAKIINYLGDMSNRGKIMGDYQKNMALKTGKKPEEIEVPGTDPTAIDQLGALVGARPPLMEGQKLLDIDKAKKFNEEFSQEMEGRATIIHKTVKMLNGNLSVEGNAYINNIRKTGTEIEKAALDMALKKGLGELPWDAPEHPFAKIGAGKADKTKGGGAGRTPSDAELLKKYNDALRDLEKTKAEEEFQNYKALQDKKRHELTLSLHRGEMDIQAYYNELKRLSTEEWKAESDILKGKIVAAQKAYQENLKAIDLKKANRGLSDSEVDLLKGYERLKLEKEIFKTNQEMGRLGIKNQKEMADIADKRLKAEIQMAELAQQTKWDLMSLAGPVSEMTAKLQKIEQDYYKKVGTQQVPAPGTTLPGVTYGPGGKQTPTTISGDEALAAMKAQQWEAQWGRLTKEAATSIAQGFSDMISSLMDGTADFKQMANKMFKSLLSTAMKPGLEQLQESLKSAFDKLFKSVGSQAGMAILGVIAMIGMMLTSSKSKSSFSPSGVQSQVTGHESVRGIIAGETSIPIAQIGVSLQDALVSTNSILDQIEANTRGLGQVQLNLTVDIPGIKEAVAKAMEQYFAEFAQTLGSK